MSITCSNLSQNVVENFRKYGMLHLLKKSKHIHIFYYSKKNIVELNYILYIWRGMEKELFKKKPGKFFVYLKHGF